MLKPIGYYT